VIDLFNYMTSILGPENRLHVVTATRLAMAGQVIRPAEELKTLYEKMKLPTGLAEKDHLQNRQLLKRCEQLGNSLTK
jgi:hypothetical protein